MSKKNQFRKWLWISVIAVFTILWYTTPLADVVSEVLITSFVPRYLDVELGKRGVASAEYVLSEDRY